MTQENGHQLARFNLLMRMFAVLLASLFFSMTLAEDTMTSRAFLLINQGLFVTLVGYLLLPLPKTPLGLLANSTATVLAFLMVSQLLFFDTIPLVIVFRMCLVIFCFALLWTSLTQLLTKIFPDRYNWQTWIIVVTAFIFTAPVWLGPVVDVYLPNNGIINSIIAITPLTHFSIAAEFDFLRSEWFYRNTPFGSLPFTYPSFLGIVSSYLLLVIFLQLLLWSSVRNSKTHLAVHKQSLIIS